MISAVPFWIWAAFVAFVLALLLFDLLVFHREAHAVPLKEATIWSVVWIALGLSFTAVIWWWMGSERAGEYLAGYLLEKALSVDNMFVFALVFSYFSLPRELQHRVLFWGILGALIFRGAFIFAGAALLERFDWMFFVFGGFLVITGSRMALRGDEEVHPERNPVLRALRRTVPMTSDYRGDHFFVKDAGRRLATPMLAVLVAVETTDIVFAVDSIPAIFGVTDMPFIVFSSNAFAILGLRALFFVLAGMLHRFDYLQFGLAAVLVLIGLKMIFEELHLFEVPIWLSLGVIGATIGLSVVASLMKERREERTGAEPSSPDATGTVSDGAGRALRVDASQDGEEDASDETR